MSRDPYWFQALETLIIWGARWGAQALFWLGFGFGAGWLVQKIVIIGYRFVLGFFV